MKFTPLIQIFLVFAGLLVNTVNLWSQRTEISVFTEWSEGQKRCFPCELNTVTNEVTGTQVKELNFRGDFTFTGEVLNLSFQEVEIPSYFDKNALPSAPNVVVEFGSARGQNYLIVNYNPLILENGKVKMVKEIQIAVDGVNSPQNFDRSNSFASSSVLSSGDWYKIGVRRGGMFKIDYSFLSSIGVAMSGLNPNHINVYGNHTPRLPLLNSYYRPDDLLKNSIFIEGDADGSFDPGDYILFYATGPDEISYNTSTIEIKENSKDSMDYYFIHIDASDAPKRISSVSNSSNPVTHNVTSTNAVVYHELNDTNLLKSGDTWLGEHYDIVLDYSYNFNLDQISTTDSIIMKTRIASAKKSGTANMSLRLNGIEVDNITCPPLQGDFNVGNLVTSTTKFISTSANVLIETSFTRSSPNTAAWMDKIQLNYRRNLNMVNNQFLIRDLTSIGTGNVASYSISGASADVKVWEVTDGANAQQVNGSLSGGTFTFIQNADSLRQFVVFKQSQAFSPEFVGQFTNQNLHALPQVDYLIITHPLLKTQAQRLADLHLAQGTSVNLVEIGQVYNEFGGGAADPIAVRWFAKMFYDRAGGDPSLMPKYLCLFGDGSFDPLNRVQNNNYLLPTYQNSDPSPFMTFTGSFTSDDFFGILDDTESMSASDLIDIAVGRIPVDDIESATDVVNKVEHYMNFGSYLYSNATGIQCEEDGYSSTFGDWRNKLVLMADDENGGKFVSDCEKSADSTFKNHPEINIEKIYLDAYLQIVTSGGQRYPDVEEAINQNMRRGALVFNYVGHGGETGLAHERVVTISMIQNWANVNNLCVFISATCEFSRFDDPGRVSAGEITLTTPYGGAVALLTTTRLVYISLNSTLVQNLYSVLFIEENGEPLAMGEIIRRTKNLTAGNQNMRNFTLLGDPALKLGKPQPQIVTDSLNAVSISQPNDTLKALSKITVTGHVENNSGTLLSNYNGIVYPTVFDKQKTRTTLGQDPESPAMNFTTQNNVVYKGKSTVTNGYFSFTFVVPKDIDYNFGKGKISYYSTDESTNQYGFDTTIVVGGVDPNGINDNIGPEISLFMNDENFVNGGLTNSTPLFLAHISDENGINTTGNGIGHDIVMILDGNTADPVVLNNFYEADLDTYQSGKVTYPFTDLEPGAHQITFKAWDVNNNSSEATLDFVVVESEELGITHLLNYPNPFTTNTDFYFEHNQCCVQLEVKIEIFTVSGKLVNTLFSSVNSISYRSEAINWDGRDEYGDKLARGVYVYRLTVETPDGQKAEKIEKLVIL